MTTKQTVEDLNGLAIEIDAAIASLQLTSNQLRTMALTLSTTEREGDDE